MPAVIAIKTAARPSLVSELPRTFSVTAINDYRVTLRCRSRWPRRRSRRQTGGVGDEPAESAPEHDAPTAGGWADDGNGDGIAG